MNKVGKNIRRVSGWLLVAVLVFVAGMSIYSRVKLVDEIKAIKAAGYYNPVPTGDHSLNMYRTGNENGAHTIVAISGCSDGSMSITWRPLTSAFSRC